ncbi:hypothetical protein GQ42DRAFT_153066 [Ramicandelaber brevisporus]|nr:hypothetical protein GQ42DRAFT_153066 [Ramicandelaber brevisporus]
MKYGKGGISVISATATVLLVSIHMASGMPYPQQPPSKQDLGNIQAMVTFTTDSSPSQPTPIPPAAKSLPVTTASFSTSSSQLSAFDFDLWPTSASTPTPAPAPAEKQLPQHPAIVKFRALPIAPPKAMPIVAAIPRQHQSSELASAPHPLSFTISARSRNEPLDPKLQHFQALLAFQHNILHHPGGEIPSPISIPASHSIDLERNRERRLRAAVLQNQQGPRQRQSQSQSQGQQQQQQLPLQREQVEDMWTQPPIEQAQQHQQQQQQRSDVLPTSLPNADAFDTTAVNPHIPDSQPQQQQPPQSTQSTQTRIEQEPDPIQSAWTGPLPSSVEASAPDSTQPFVDTGGTSSDPPAIRPFPPRPHGNDGQPNLAPLPSTPSSSSSATTAPQWNSPLTGDKSTDVVDAGNSGGGLGPVAFPQPSLPATSDPWPTFLPPDAAPLVNPGRDPSTAADSPLPMIDDIVSRNGTTGGSTDIPATQPFLRWPAADASPTPRPSTAPPFPPPQSNEPKRPGAGQPSRLRPTEDDLGSPRPKPAGKNGSRFVGPPPSNPFGPFAVPPNEDHTHSSPPPLPSQQVNDNDGFSLPQRRRFPSDTKSTWPPPFKTSPLETHDNSKPVRLGP